MNKLYFTLIKITIVLIVLTVVGFSVYEKVQEKTATMRVRVNEMEELVKSNGKQQKITYVGNQRLGYLVYNDKSNVYLKDLKDTVKIVALFKILDSTKIMQKYEKLK